MEQLLEVNVLTISLSLPVNELLPLHPTYNSLTDGGVSVAGAAVKLRPFNPFKVNSDVG